MLSALLTWKIAAACDDFPRRPYALTRLPALGVVQRQSSFGVRVLSSGATFLSAAKQERLNAKDANGRR